MKTKTSGFTLTELMITIVIVGIMAALAMPAMRDFIDNTRIINRSEQIANLMRFAKGEAVRRNLPVVICGVNVRKDGRPSGVCDNKALSSGMLAFIDVDKNGKYDSTIDTDLRTISINGNNHAEVKVNPDSYKINISSKNTTVVSDPDSVNEYVFLPNGSFALKTTKASLANLKTSTNYARFVLTSTNNSNKAQRVRIVVINPMGKVDVCKNNDNYEQPIICKAS